MTTKTKSRGHWAGIILSLIMNISLLTNWVEAAFSLPPYVYKADRLAEAQEAAGKLNKPIIFLYSDKQTTCPLCTDASNDVLYKFKDMGIIVYCEEKKSLPSLVQDAMNSPEAGKYIPITVITNPSVQKVIYILPYIERAQRPPYLQKTEDAILNH